MYMHAHMRGYSKEGTLHTEMEAFLKSQRDQQFCLGGFTGYIATESIREGMPNDPLYLGRQVSLCIHACLYTCTHGM